MRSAHLKITISIFLIVATILPYWQTTSHDFITLDDVTYVTDNPHVRAGLTLEGMSWAFTTFHAANWHPLTWLSHMLDCQLFGLSPGMHHITSLFFHIANALLLFLVLGKATGSLWRSAFVAGMFALHPLHVESVAWVAERKDVLSTFFWMLTIWAYVRYTARPGFTRYLLIILFFFLALMAKPMVVTLPFVLLLMDYWPLGRVQTKHSFTALSFSFRKSSPLFLVLEKSPLFIMAGLSCIVTFVSQNQGTNVSSLDKLPIGPRIANALVSYISYIKNMIWPKDLAVLYPHPVTVPAWEMLGAGLLLMSLSILFLRATRSRPYLTVGWLWYLGTLVPVIGLVQVGVQAMADRYTYIPIIGLFIMVAWAIPDVLQKWRYRRAALWMSGTLLLSALLACTWLQVRHWKDSISLFTHTVKVTENNYRAMRDLGIALDHAGRHNSAIEAFSKSLLFSPNNPKTHRNLGVTLANLGRLDDAARHYYIAIDIDPHYAEAHIDLAKVLTLAGNIDNAISEFSKALEIQSDNAGAHYNLGVLLARKGRFSEALNHYSEVLRIKPDDLKANNNLSVVLLNLGRFDEAVKRLSSAVRVNPNDAGLHYNLGVVLAHLDKLEDAIREFREALRIRPDYQKARRQLDLALKRNDNLSRTSHK